MKLTMLVLVSVLALVPNALLPMNSFADVKAMSGTATSGGSASNPPPLKALLIAGGCCHDYTNQQKVLSEGIQARANVRVDVYWSNDSSTAPVFPLYTKPGWAAGYDVIIHDECAASVRDPALVDRIIQTHQKIPAVHLHCAMHSFRADTNAWFKHLGLQSSSHGPQKPIAIDYVDTEHPIALPLENWTTINEELYNNVKLYGAHPIAIGKQLVGTGDKEKMVEAVVAWTNETQGARSFSTTIGHNTKTVQDARYLDLVTRGLLWSCGKLNKEYLRPYQGKSESVLIDSAKVKKPEPMVKLPPMPENATLVKVTASSTETVKNNFAYHAVDGNQSTRWCASNGTFPQWLQLEFEKPRQLKEIRIDWESGSQAYRYRVEGSVDGKSWNTLLDRRNNANPKVVFEPLQSDKRFRFMRITGFGVATSPGNFCSIREVQLKGDSIERLWPAITDNQTAAFVPINPPPIDPFKEKGNMTPRIEPLSAETVASIRNNVQVPEGFEFTIFAAPPAVNYPVFVAAAPDGTLYVSSDGNGSLGRDPGRGRVIRLRDTDDDGHADETKVFCEVDAPRGLVWDHDRLYLMHPPHLSAFIDHDGDGVADEEKVLVKNLAFGYDKRPADHTTNGVSLGPDGWLYIAGGDFGFIDAEGTDGRKLTHRGGGVLRVRPDGTGLEVYSTGTRNILEVAISPTMDIFARDNTNDGGGWDVRLHHFTGMDDHGYPRLYMNFGDECVQPLADYGGGSGCGAVYLDEPGFGKWNDAPLTADWGTGGLYRHSVAPSGATFKETAAPERLVKMTRPTDADVDGMSRLYCASWRGATFKWVGTDVGYIVQVRPKGFKPQPLPKFESASDDELVGQLKSSSYRRRIAAQRELKRRGNPASEQLLSDEIATRSEKRNLAEYLQTDASDAECIAALSDNDPIIVHIAVRSLAHHRAHAACLNAIDKQNEPSPGLFRALAMMHTAEAVDGLLQRLANSDQPSTRRGILSALCRLHYHDGKWNGSSWGTRPDTRGPYYQPDPWAETDKIAAALKHQLSESSPEEAAFLVETMRLNRIQSNDAVEKIISLAEQDPRMIPAAMSQLAKTDDLPSRGFDLATKAANDSKVTPETLAHAITVLSKGQGADAVSSLLTALGQVTPETSNQVRQSAIAVVKQSNQLGQHLDVVIASADSPIESAAYWADLTLLAVLDQSDSSPEAKSHARQAIDQSWSSPKHRARLISAATELKSHQLDEQILVAINDSEAEVVQVAKAAIEQLKLEVREADRSPKISSLPVGDALTQATKLKGDAGLGAQLFTKATCVACHTVSKDEIQKGPFLGNIAKTYKRPELVAAILQPAKTIAQGFATNAILTYDGLLVTGFVTSEQSDRVTLRDQLGKEHEIDKEEIEVRKILPTSIMPEGLMSEFTVAELASLVAYLESLAE
ncbi:DUF7133 domain-containing protein [Neorhodopirellula lusitana]|uniref:DUF7133 domain-containing protein n=1 Tax=Neorhodopirellula lusitana TaxID=445327 RepID=UPI00384F884D